MKDGHKAVLQAWNASTRALNKNRISLQQENSRFSIPNSTFSVLYSEFLTSHSGLEIYHPQVRYLCIESEASRPAPMARITVACPVTISPPAQTPFLVVLPVSGSATI